MSIESELRAIVLASFREAAAESRAEMGRSRMLAIKPPPKTKEGEERESDPWPRAPVAYRAILAAEKAGEIVVYRIGHASFVDEAELYEWIRRTGIRVADSATLSDSEPAKQDDVDRIIAANDQRRKRRTA